MQTVHSTVYMIRNTRGHYEKTIGNEGTGYVMFQTRGAARAYVEYNKRNDWYIVKARTAITPIDTGRTERLVAIRQTRPQKVSQAHQTEFRF
jgi:hypothetical protein